MLGYEASKVRQEACVAKYRMAATAMFFECNRIRLAGFSRSNFVLQCDKHGQFEGRTNGERQSCIVPDDRRAVFGRKQRGCMRMFFSRARHASGAFNLGMAGFNDKPEI